MPLFAVVPTSGWAYWSSEVLLPTLLNGGIVLDPNQDSTVAYLYRVLQSEYDLQWVESWVQADLRKSFSATFGPFLSRELPFSKLLVTQPQLDIYHIQAVGSSGQHHTFDLVLTAETKKLDRILALANLAGETLTSGS